MGFAQYMVSSMKSNSRRQERTPFDKESLYLSGNSKKEKLQFKKATKEQLLKIRNRMKQSNSIYQQKLIGYTITAIAIIIPAVYYFFFNINITYKK